LRFDNHEIRIRDNFLLNNDISGGVDYSVWNPSLGLSYSLNENTAVYANYSTSFETPTLNELTNNPLALEGPNTFLDPQEAKNIELGLKMKDTDKLKLDINLFNVRTSNDLVPYELTNFPGKTFFRNIGSSIRTGLELNAYYSILQNLNADLTYTLSSFNYDSYAVNDLSFDGNVLPGVPSHVASLQLNYQHDLGLSMSLYNQYVGLIYVADDNLESTPSYLMSNFRISYEHQLSNFRVVPFLGVNNLLNTEYNDNIRINAFLNSYYEPAPGRNYFGGLKVLF